VTSAARVSAPLFTKVVQLQKKPARTCISHWCAAPTLHSSAVCKADAYSVLMFAHSAAPSTASSVMPSIEASGIGA
jgi:hypothetical protein